MRELSRNADLAGSWWYVSPTAGNRVARLLADIAAADPDATSTQPSSPRRGTGLDSTYTTRLCTARRTPANAICPAWRGVSVSCEPRNCVGAAGISGPTSALGSSVVAAVTAWKFAE